MPDSAAAIRCNQSGQCGHGAGIVYSTDKVDRRAQVREGRLLECRQREVRGATIGERGERHAILAGDEHPVSGPDLQAHELGGDGVHRIGKRAIAPDAPTFEKGRMVRPLGDMARDDLVHPVRKSLENVRRGQCIDHFRQGVLPHLGVAGRDLRPVFSAVRLPPVHSPRRSLPPRRAADPCRSTSVCRRRRSASRTRHDRPRPASAPGGGS